MRPLLEFRGGFRVLGHPAHVMLIHFPLALLFLVLPLELAGWLGGSAACWRLAWLAEAGGLLAVIPAAITGLIDLAGQPGNRGVSSLGNTHMLAMMGAATLFGTALWLKAGGGPVPPPRLFAILALSLGANALLAWGAWLGGEMVFHHGAGRRET
jgi:uncharacterized membrane protein